MMWIGSKKMWKSTRRIKTHDKKEKKKNHVVE